MSPSMIFVLALVLLVVVLIFMGVKSVPQSMEWMVQRFGKYTRTLSPGLHFIIPVVDRIAFRLSLRETVLDVPPQEVITRDNATVMTDGVVFYQVIDSPRAAYQVADMDRALTNLAMTNLRTVIGAMDLDDVLSNRDEINDRLMRVVDEASEPWGVKITRIEIKDLQPPGDMVQSMGRQMKAVREKRAQITEAEGEREAQILRAQGAREAAILEAQGELEAAKLEAEARERLAQAEANATRDVSIAIREGDLQAINYFVATKYLEAFGKFADSPNQKTLILPAETSAVMGSLAGIGEIAKQIFGGGGGGGGGGTGGGGTGGGGSGGGGPTRGPTPPAPRPRPRETVPEAPPAPADTASARSVPRASAVRQPPERSRPGWGEPTVSLAPGSGAASTPARRGSPWGRA